MRQQVQLVYADTHDETDERKSIFIYSHWGGGETYKESNLADSVKRALAKKLRWDDESYLARMIFSEVIKDDIEGETSYGLAPESMDEEFPRIVIDLQKKTVDGISYEKFISLYD